MKNKFIKFITAFAIIFAINNVIAQNKSICEIIADGQQNLLSKDNIGAAEVSIYKNEELIFSWYGHSIIKNLGNKKEIFCLIADPVLNKVDSFRYESKVLATIRIDTAICKFKKEIFAHQLQSKSTKDLLDEYTRNKKLYKNVNRINKGRNKADYLLRYSYDLMYAAISGDSLAAERLLMLNKDFKLFRDGLDAEDLTYLRSHLYDLYIIDKPVKYRERYRYLSLIRY